MANIHERLYEGESRSHVPALPFWVAIIRVVQLLFAFLVLCLTAFAASVFGSVFFEGYPMSWFTFIWTVGFLVYIFVTPLFAPQFYNYWVHLGVEGLTVIFWLTSFALLAQEDQAWNAAENIIGDDGYSFDSKASAAIDATKAATAFAAFNWVLFVATLITFGYHLNRHRIANGRTGFGGSAAPNGGDVETAQVQADQQPQIYQQVPLEQQQPQVYQQVPVSYVS